MWMGRSPALLTSVSKVGGDRVYIKPIILRYKDFHDINLMCHYRNN